MPAEGQRGQLSVRRERDVVEVAEGVGQPLGAPGGIVRRDVDRQFRGRATGKVIGKEIGAKLVDDAVVRETRILDAEVDVMRQLLRIGAVKRVAPQVITAVLIAHDDEAIVPEHGTSQVDVLRSDAFGLMTILQIETPKL